MNKSMNKNDRKDNKDEKNKKIEKNESRRTRPEASTPEVTAGFMDVLRPFKDVAELRAELRSMPRGNSSGPSEVTVEHPVELFPSTAPAT